jgi:hypothetical protein
MLWARLIGLPLTNSFFGGAIGFAFSTGGLGAKFGLP